MSDYGSRDRHVTENVLEFLKPKPEPCIVHDWVGYGEAIGSCNWECSVCGVLPYPNAMSPREAALRYERGIAKYPCGCGELDDRKCQVHRDRSP